jgi:hypothetical protein
VVLTDSHGISRAPCYLGYSSRQERHFDYGTHTHSGPAFNPVRLYLTRHRDCPAEQSERSHNPDHATPAGYHTWLGLASSAFARHYLRNHGCFLFLWVLRCFTSPRSLYPPYIFRRESPGHPKGLAGFPHSEILGSKLVYQLPEAYRRLRRPSSAPDAKASTVCS